MKSVHLKSSTVWRRMPYGSLSGTFSPTIFPNLNWLLAPCLKNPEGSALLVQWWENKAGSSIEPKRSFSIDPSILVPLSQNLCIFLLNPSSLCFKSILILSLLWGWGVAGLDFVACQQNPSAGCRFKNLTLGLCVWWVCLIMVTIFFPVYMAYVSFPLHFPLLVFS